MAKSRRRPDEDEDDDAQDDGPVVPRRKRKSAVGPTKMVFRIVGGVLGALALVVLLYWVYSPVGTDSSMLCYFPRETTRLQGYEVDDGLRVVKLKEVHDTLLNNYRVFGTPRWREEAGVKETDVLRYLSGTVTGNPEEERDLAAQDKRGTLTVIKFKKEVDENQFVGSFTGAYKCDPMDHSGKKFYQLWTMRRVPPDNHEEREDDVSFFFPTKKILVYATTRREIKEALNKSPGKISLEGSMRTMASQVDGHYFSCQGSYEEPVQGVSNSMAFGLGFIDADLRDERGKVGVIGTGSWFASNGNDFLYCSANLYADRRTAADVKAKLAAGYRTAQEEIYQSEAGKPKGLTDPFNPPQPKTAGGAPMGGGGNVVSNEQTKDILEALAEYSKTARVDRRGNLVVVEGLIPHGNPEQGTFEKFWKAIGPRFQFQRPGMGGMMGPGMGGPPLPPPQGGLPPGAPGGPPGPGR